MQEGIALLTLENAMMEQKESVDVTPSLIFLPS